MSNLDSEAGRSAIREHLSRGSSPESLVQEYSLGWADEAVVRDEARQRDSWSSRSSSMTGGGTEGSGASSGSPLLGLLFLLGLGYLAIGALLSWMSENPFKVLGILVVLMLIPAAFYAYKFFAPDRDPNHRYAKQNGYSPYTRWKIKRDEKKAYFDLVQAMVREMIDHEKAGTTDFIVQTLSRLWLDNYTATKKTESIREDLLKEPSLKHRPDLFHLYATAFLVLELYFVSTSRFRAPSVAVLKEVLVAEAKIRGGKPAMKRIKSILYDGW